MNNTKVIVALDYPDAKSALDFVGRVTPELCKLKIGKELFTREGPQLVRQLVEQKFDVFLDLKFHDIPNTVKKACHAAADLGVWMLNVHAMGGRAMMEAALEGIEASAHRPYLIAVTVLTSMDQTALAEIGIDVTPQQQVLKLADLVRHSHLDGVVCSAQEASSLRAATDESFLLVTPGIRPALADAGDQKRIMTPQQAISAGASYLVIGRPITQADDPLCVLQSINSELC